MDLDPADLLKLGQLKTFDLPHRESRACLHSNFGVRRPAHEFHHVGDGKGERSEIDDRLSSRGVYLIAASNNTAERRMRNPGMGRKNYYGSGRQWSAELAAMMFSLFQTLLLWQLNPHHWLQSYLTACAENGGQSPADITPFIPWQMSEERKQQLAKPIIATDQPVPEQPSSPQPP